MPKRWKKGIAVFLVSALFSSLLLQGHAQPVYAGLIDYTDKTAEDLVTLQWPAGETVALTTRDGRPSFQLTLPEGRETAGPRIALDTRGKDMSAATYLEFHVTGPGQAVGGEENFTLNVDLYTQAAGQAEQRWSMATTGMVAGDDAKVEGSYFIRRDGETAFKPYGGADDNAWLMNDFSGYVRVPLDHFVVKCSDGGDTYAGPADFHAQDITGIVLWLGQLTPNTDGTLYLDDFRISPQPRPIPEGDALISFADSPAAEDLVTLQWPDGETVALVDRDGVPSIKLILPEGRDSAGPRIALDTRGKDMSKAAYLEFHVVGPGQATGGQENFTLNAQLYTQAAGQAEQRWSMAATDMVAGDDTKVVGSYFICPDGETAFTPYGGADGKAWLLNDFSGYVRVPLDHFVVKCSDSGDIYAGPADFHAQDITGVVLWMSLLTPNTDGTLYLDDFRIAAGQEEEPGGGDPDPRPQPEGNALISFADDPAVEDLATLLYPGSETITLTTRDEAPSFKLTLPDGCETAGPRIALDTRGKDMSKAAYLEFHVVGPGQAAGGQENFALNAQLYTQAAGQAEQRWSMATTSMAAGDDAKVVASYFIRPDGETTFKPYGGETDCNAWLMNDFSGYVRVPLDHYVVKCSDSGDAYAGPADFHAQDITGIVLWLGQLTPNTEETLYLDDFRIVTGPDEEPGDDPDPRPQPEGNALISFADDPAVEDLAYLQWPGDETLTLAKRDGIDSFKLSLAAGKTNAGPTFILDTRGKDMAAAEYIAFHVQGPGTTDTGDQENFSMNVQLYTRESADTPLVRWTMADADMAAAGLNRVLGAYEVKADGQTDYMPYGEGMTTWPSKNFSGYVRVPLKRYVVKAEGEADPEYVGNAAFDPSKIVAMVVWTNVPGQANSPDVYFDSIQVVPKKTLRPQPSGNDLIYFDDTTKVSDVFRMAGDGGCVLVDGPDGGKLFKVTAPDGTGDMGPTFLFDVRGKDMSKAAYLEFYYKGPGTTEADDAANMALNMHLYTQADENAPEERWSMATPELAAAQTNGVLGAYFIKAKGDSEWTLLAQGNTAWISKNFEGYIRIPFSAFAVKDVNGTDTYVGPASFNPAHLTAGVIWATALGNPLGRDMLFGEFRVTAADGGAVPPDEGGDVFDPNAGDDDFEEPPDIPNDAPEDDTEEDSVHTGDTRPLAAVALALAGAVCIGGLRRRKSGRIA